MKIVALAAAAALAFSPVLATAGSHEQVGGIPLSGAVAGVIVPEELGLAAGPVIIGGVICIIVCGDDGGPGTPTTTTTTTTAPAN